MFLRCSTRKKSGKEHRYWSIVENKRCAGQKVVQRHVLYLGEINDPQQAAWQKTIDLCEEGQSQPQTVALFPEDRPFQVDEKDIVRIRLSEMQLRRPRQWGACWLAGHLYEELQLDKFWAERLPPSRKGTRWDLVLQTLCSYRLIDPGSEWRLHRQWFESSAMGDLLGEDFSLADTHKLYECHDLLVEHKSALFEHLIVTPEGFPLAYEVMPGNTSDKTTLKGFLEKIEKQYGKAQRTWVMDRGIPTEKTLAAMRQSDPPVLYLVGTPKGRLTKLEAPLAELPWHQARPGVEVKLLAQEEETYVFAKSLDRLHKERSMRRRQLRWLWKRLKELQGMELKRDQLLMKLGAARPQAPSAWRLVKITVPPRPKKGQPLGRLEFSLRKDKLRRIRKREGRYLLRTNLCGYTAEQLWEMYLQLVQVEEAFKHLKGDLSIRPIFHQDEDRIQAHIFVSFLAYCLQVTLTRRLKDLAPGLSARSVLEKMAAMQMIDVHLPATDGREVILTRYTQPEAEQKILLEKLKLKLPEQPPPKIMKPKQSAN